MIAIIGAGISGLSLGHYLKKNGVNDFVIFEKSDYAGGKIKTDLYEDYFLEFGPNTLLTTPLLKDLIYELGLEDELVKPSEESTKNRFIFKNNEVVCLPSSPKNIFFNSVVGIKSKLSVFKDLRMKPAKVSDFETVSHFFERHFTKEVVEVLVKTFCRGIYAANADELMIKTSFPTLVEYEEKYGSILKGIKANTGLEKREVISFKKGQSALVQALVSKLAHHIHYSHDIQSIIESEKGFLLNGYFKSTAVVFANEAKSIAKLLKEIKPNTALALEKVKYSGVQVIHSIYNQNRNNFPYKGFGILYPPKESDAIFGHIWNSKIFPQFGEDKTIMTTMAAIEANALDEELDHCFKSTFGLDKRFLEKRQSMVWKYGIPIYNREHFEFLKQNEKENKLNLYICSNVLNGVSVPDRIFESKKIAALLSK